MVNLSPKPEKKSEHSSPYPSWYLLQYLPQPGTYTTQRLSSAFRILLRPRRDGRRQEGTTLAAVHIFDPLLGSVESEKRLILQKQLEAEAALIITMALEALKSEGQYISPENINYALDCKAGHRALKVINARVKWI
jgi:hypothetical protein